ncbi:MAG TPA: Gfo/Idh/MocA family oxidoreductase [Streptosporangiaceae bacterium]|nr:Gfo/Idh/MocA family oxidoreductase [Streptosporangiaceae bacterium]
MRVGVAGVGRIGTFHADALHRLPQVRSMVVYDPDSLRATRLADRLGIETAHSVDALLDAGLDGLVIATPTGAHAELIVRGVRAGIPVFCEKPVAPDIEGTLDTIKQAGDRAIPVQVGFQRRFDSGYCAARQAVQSGGLGWIHTLRATTLDPEPPPAEYIASSGGLFRDCAVHDFDAVRWVTGREAAEVYALGANRGAEFFREAGDVDTASAMLTMDDGALALVSNSRYNGAGYDVRLEVLGSLGSISAGLDDRVPLRSAETGVGFPAGRPYPGFTERFRSAYEAELAAFLDLAAGGSPEHPTMEDALEAFYIAEACEVSRARHEPVRLAEVRR